MLYRDKRIWAAAAAAVLLLANLVFWAVHSYQRAQLRDVLNASEGFANPPLQIVFPDVIADNDANRALLEPGVRSGVWTARELGGSTPHLQVLLSRQGREWFSDVGRQITATCLAGTRQVTRVLEIEDSFPSRRARFRYVWRQVHPATRVLGENAPVAGQEYEGDAMFLYEGQQWHALHWNTPQLDGAAARLSALQPDSSVGQASKPDLLFAVFPLKERKRAGVGAGGQSPLFQRQLVALEKAKADVLLPAGSRLARNASSWLRLDERPDTAESDPP